MPKLTIDKREVEVPEGATVLDAARKLGIEIPTLCFMEGIAPSTSCLVCMVKIDGERPRLVPSCGTRAQAGMVVESETKEVHTVRRSALELLLSDHLGDCIAPCQFACPAGMDIPRMLRAIAAEDFAGALRTVKRDIALPAVLGRICPAPCEKACRRRPADGPVGICLLKRFVADVDLGQDEPYLPEREPPSGKRVAIVGAGPAGTAAAYYLQQRGHACTLFDENEKPGGRLLTETTENELPRDVLAAEIDSVVRLGAELRMNTRVGDADDFARLRKEFDAVLVACGARGKEQAEAWGLQVGGRGIDVERETYRTSFEGVFAAGNAVRTKGMVIRSVADGKEAAAAIDQHLRGEKVTGSARPFSTRIGRLEEDELRQYLASASDALPREPSRGTHAGFTAAEAIEQAARCMHCDCLRQTDCRLRHWSAIYGADPRKYKAGRRPFQQHRQQSGVVFEPGKCIDCGLCIEIARAAGEPLGLTFVGRGFDVRVGVPFDESLDEALKKVAAECVAACPTAALAWGEGKSRG
jgi:NADPH-dependent glutamate synthase beta subunit-like oxidoreductase/ferredoxin